MPAALHATLESEGGWAELLKRRTTKAKREMNNEQRKAVKFAVQQKKSIAKLKTVLDTLGTNFDASVGDAQDLGSASCFQAISNLSDLCSAVKGKQAARVDLARKRGGGHASEQK
eukprot:6692717-Prymnesium_polylepis.1